MTIVQLHENVETIRGYAHDDEVAHGMEDDLMRSWIRAKATPEELSEFDRLWSTDFARWCA